MNKDRETFNDDEMIEIGLYRKAMVKSIRMINLEQVEEAKKELIRILDNYDLHYSQRDNNQKGRRIRSQHENS